MICPGLKELAQIRAAFRPDVDKKAILATAFPIFFRDVK
ncbi:MAG: hypothetical protein RL768_1709 [Nitrospirota bacterium]|jgi:hypothetical protein